jgi:hypothetical protein
MNFFKCFGAGSVGNRVTPLPPAIKGTLSTPDAQMPRTTDTVTFRAGTYAIRWGHDETLINHEVYDLARYNFVPFEFIPIKVAIQTQPMVVCAYSLVMFKEDFNVTRQRDGLYAGDLMIGKYVDEIYNPVPCRDTFFMADEVHEMELMVAKGGIGEDWVPKDDEYDTCDDDDEVIRQWNVDYVTAVSYWPLMA